MLEINNVVPQVLGWGEDKISPSIFSGWWPAHRQKNCQLVNMFKSECEQASLYRGKWDQLSGAQGKGPPELEPDYYMVCIE